MKERDYYRLATITASDVNFLKEFIGNTGSGELRQLHRNLVIDLGRIANGNAIIQQSDKVSVAEKELVQALVIETEDNLQGAIEQKAKPLLDELRQGRADFINDNETAIAFFHFIAHQYFRTKRVREAIGKELSQLTPGIDFSRLKHIVCHIGAVNVGLSLFLDRNAFDIVFLQNRTRVGFITGDQPIVNLLGTGDGRETTELAFYYPVSPDLACLISPKEYRLCSVDIPLQVVEELNRLMAYEANDSLVANSNEVLQRVLNKPSTARPSGSRILDSLPKSDGCG